MKKNIANLRESFLRKGQTAEARLVSRLLRDGYVQLGLTEAAATVEDALLSIGCNITYNRSDTVAIAYCY